MSDVLLSDVAAANIRKLIDRYDGGNQSAAARRIQMPQRSLNRIASGGEGFTLKSLEDIATAYQFEPWQLLILDFNPDKPPQIFEMGPREIELYARLEELRKDLEHLKK